MTLSEKRRRLEDLFLGKVCKLKYCHGGSETIGTGKTAVTTIITGQEWKRVTKVLIYGPPSGWYWTAKFEFEDGTISGSFDKIKDVETREK